MNNVYFSNEGLTSTSANFYANIAKELADAATERLNNVKFFKTSVAVIGSSEKQLMTIGNDNLNFIKSDLQAVASMNAFCAWIREAIKEKDNETKIVSNKTMEAWAEENGIELIRAPKYPNSIEEVSETDIINSWDINKRNKYLRLEAFAATFGKYIHPEGAYNKARIKAHNMLNNPITSTGEGRDTVLRYHEPSIGIEYVDGMFLELQNQYRSYEKELNQMKAEIKDSINAISRKRFDEHQHACDVWQAEHKTWEANWDKLRNQFFAWRVNELERLSNLKIVIPNELKDTFDIIKLFDGTSK